MSNIKCFLMKSRSNLNQCANKYGKCVVRNCAGKISSKDKISLFSLPQNENTLLLWKQKLKMPILRKCARICCRHFSAKYIHGNRLRRDAIPTRRIGNDIDDDISDSEEKDYEIKRYERRRYCCIKTCSMNSKSSKLFHFPTEESRKLVWMSACQLKEKNIRTMHLYICDNHFSQKYLGKRRLAKCAVPDRNLPMVVSKLSEDSEMEFIRQSPLLECSKTAFSTQCQRDYQIVICRKRYKIEEFK